MSDLAPGQILGYTMQYFRALHYLVVGYPGTKVSIEKIADVAIEDADGTVVLEEDKSSIGSSPITNRSVDLWKTIHNWVHKIQSNEIDVENTLFILYSNKKGRKSLIDDISAAHSAEDALTVLAKIKLELSDLDNKHEAWDYFNYSTKENSGVFLAIIPKIEYHFGENIGIDALKKELLGRKQIPIEHHDFFIEKMLGWLVKNISEKITNRLDAILNWEEYNIESSHLLERIRMRQLIDFTNHTISGEKINEVKSARAFFVKQLDLIDASEEELIEAVTCFLQAQSNIQRWIESGIINQDIAKDFEERLIRYWRSKKKINELREDQADPVRIGKILLNECLLHTETINNQSPPASTIPGTYHILANDDPKIGWHPRWNELLKEH